MFYFRTIEKLTSLIKQFIFVANILVEDWRPGTGHGRPIIKNYKH